MILVRLPCEVEAVWDLCSIISTIEVDTYFALNQNGQ